MPPTGLVTIYEQTPTNAKMHYIYTDYLGSLRCITDESGTVEQYLSYDAWGKRRHAKTGAPFLSLPANLMFARGYTGHEHLDEFGLINMNGRIYDPTLALFLSPDPYIQAPDFTQNFNRYAYCLNNPLMYSDPSGEIIHILVGAAIGGLMNWAMSGGEFSWKGLGAFAIRAVAGGVSAGVSTGIKCASAGASFWAGFVGSQQGISVILSVGYTSGFTNGFLSGLGAGFSGGLISGTGNSLLAGQNFGQALGNGFKSGVIGGFTGGVTNGLIEGLNNLTQLKKHFASLISDDLPINSDGSIDYNTANAEKYWKAFFGDTPGLNELYTNGEGINKRITFKNGEYSNGSDKGPIGGLTDPIMDVKRRSNVYLCERVFKSKWRLYNAMGHEKIHVTDFYSGKWNPLVTSSSYWTEFRAYSWNLKEYMKPRWNADDLFYGIQRPITIGNGQWRKFYDLTHPKKN